MSTAESVADGSEPRHESLVRFGMTQAFALRLRTRRGPPPGLTLLKVGCLTPGGGSAASRPVTWTRSANRWQPGSSGALDSSPPAECR